MNVFLIFFLLVFFPCKCADGDDPFGDGWFDISLNEDPGVAPAFLPEDQEEERMEKAKRRRAAGVVFALDCPSAELFAPPSMFTLPTESRTPARTSRVRRKATSRPIEPIKEASEESESTAAEQANKESEAVRKNIIGKEVPLDKLLDGEVLFLSDEDVGKIFAIRTVSGHNYCFLQKISKRSDCFAIEHSDATVEISNKSTLSFPSTIYLPGLIKRVVQP